MPFKKGISFSVYSNDLKQKKAFIDFLFSQNNKNLSLPLTQSLFLHHHTLRDLHFCNKIIFIFWDPSALCFVQLQTLKISSLSFIFISCYFHSLLLNTYSRGISISTIHKHRKKKCEMNFTRCSFLAEWHLFYI